MSMEMFWQEWFRVKPCLEGWRRFKAGVESLGLEAAVQTAPTSDRQWGAENTYRVELIDLLAKDERWDVRKAVARNVNAPAETLAVLANDPNEDVRFVALDRLTKPEST